MIYHVVAEERRIYQVVYEVEAETEAEAREMLETLDPSVQLVSDECFDVESFEVVKTMEVVGGSQA